MNTPSTPKNPVPVTDTAALDTLTGGAFSAPTSGERAARVRDWLASGPTPEAMADVFRELSHRDKGAAKPLKEKLDELKRAKAQESIAEEWALKAQALIDAPRLNLADAMGWQRDAAKAGAPLSREPLASLKHTLAERMKAFEDLQKRVQVEAEAAVLLTQRIEVLSTKPWREAETLWPTLKADVATWQTEATQLGADPLWDSLEPRFGQQLHMTRQHLQLVWEAFDAALTQAVAAAQDAQAPLPQVHVWADELRAQRGEAVQPERQPADKPGLDPAVQREKRAAAEAAVTAALAVLQKEVAEGHGKSTPKAAAELRAALKTHGRHVPAALEAEAQAALAQAGELEGWQRWRADQLREELVAKATALTQAPDGQTLGGRKMQETLRQLREQWKTTDQGGVPNHALWKRFDEACNQAHKVVEQWLDKVRQQADAHKAQRLALIAEVKAWAQAHATDTDWKAQQRALHAYAEGWRQAGHLSEKQFAELQPQWKEAMQLAHAPLETAQAASLSRRQALIQEAEALGAAPVLRIDAVRALQQRWQAEAQAVSLDRKQEQKLWEAFRQPIDAAFARKTTERQQAQSAISAHDQRVLDAARSLQEASASGDASRIRQAMQAMEDAQQGAAPPSDAPAAPQAPAAVVEAPATSPSDSADAPGAAVPDAAAPKAPASPPKKLIAVRGDDRPGMKKTEPVPAGRGARPPSRDGRDGRPGGPGAPFSARAGADWAPRGPRLGDAAFRAQRDAMEMAQASLKKLAAQAHGEVLGQLLGAWAQRDASALPAAQALGGKVSAPTRQAWVQALQAAPTAASAGPSAQALLRLEMAAESPTPAEHLEQRRALQLQLLTRRHDPAPAQTWAQDTATVLASAHDSAAERRLQAALKVLLRR